jgi:ribosome maturation factor RimP
LSANRLKDLLQPLVEDLGYEFVGLEYSSSPRHAVLRVYIDNEGGVDIDDCSKVSHEVAALLDVEDPISGQYNLEISSPGLDRPLFTREQYQRFAGEVAQVSLFAPEGGRRKFKGRILGVDDDRLMLEQDGAEVALNFNNIAKGRLVPDYDKLMSGQGGQKA